MIHRTGNRLSTILLALFALLFTSHAAGNLTVSVDRTEISDADLLKLVIRLENVTTSTTPDFSVLEQDFEIIQRSGPNQSSRISIVNGRQTSEVFVTWELRLRPKRLGVLTIPAFRMGSSTSRPIQIRVNKQSEAMKRKMSQLVFFDTSVDTTETYVQGQILYTVKLFYVENISGDFPAAPVLNDAVVEIIENERRYDTISNGRRYYVLEKRYGIYPQKSGTLTIPAQTFSGYRVGPGFFSTREPVLSRSEAHTIEVKPKPSNYPGEHWLPAAELTLESTWLGGDPDFVVGEPINRSIEINAKGVATSLLPPLPEITAAGVKTYQDPPVEEQTVTADGLTAKQTTVVGIVPTEPGQLTLPEVRIPWWNTQTDSLEYAVIPAQTFTVAPSLQNPVVVPTDPATTAANQTPVLTSEPSAPGLPWQWISLGLLVLWLLTLMLWLRQAFRRDPNRSIRSENASPQATDSEKSALAALQKACQAGDGLAAQRALINWANIKFGNVRAMQDLAQMTRDEALLGAVRDLEQSLFAREASGSWRGEALFSAVKNLKPPAQQGQTTLSALNPV
ncbi:MAG: BatD family protein [Pseudomonadales bacterium]